MNKDINLALFNLQDDGSWTEDANTIALLKAADLTSEAIDICQTEGEVGVQAFHASDGAATLLVEILESVDGVTFVLNSTELVAALAPATPAVYLHDAKANRFIKIMITNNGLAATVVTLSLTVR